MLIACQRAASSGEASTSTFTILSLPACSAARAASTGAIIRHGAHQAAQKSTTTGTLALVEPTSEGLDFCTVRSRHGRITVGVSGVDQLEAASEGGLMKKLGALVLGPEIMRTVDLLQNARGEQLLAHLAARR